MQLDQLEPVCSCRLRLADLQEVQRLHRRVGELQGEVARLYTALTEARLQLP